MTQRLGRIVRIIVMLQAGLRCNALRIAAESGVHRRTVFRDFAALRSLGFPILFDGATGCYYLPRGAASPSDQGMAEFLSLFQNTASGALVDLISEDSNAETSERANQINQLVWQDLLASEKLFPEILAQLIAAVQSQHRVLLVKAYGAAEERQVTLRIKQVLFGVDGWCVLGTKDSGDFIQVPIEAIAECIEADELDASSLPPHE